MEIHELANWEFMDAIWVGEAIGFSEWLRLESDPDVLRSLSISFGEFPEGASKAVLQALELAVEPGMSAEKLGSLLGAPVKEHRFADDRVTYEFMTAAPSPYEISCTVLNEGGLVHLVVMRPLPEASA